MYTPQGKPRVAVFSIAHLGDAERMFFVSLLLNQIVAWMRGQTGTTSLRAIVYMDEILGYFPPVANPPSKAPLLTLLKQGRAFGIGVVLATQNPVDLDYKGLANTGTWFLGRLQTERDKARMLDGLEGAAGGSMDRDETDRLLSALDKRVFLLHNVHEKGPVVFQTRWTLSYLRGPLSRDQIRQLTPARAGGCRLRAAHARWCLSQRGRRQPRDRRRLRRQGRSRPGPRRSCRPASSSSSFRPAAGGAIRYRPSSSARRASALATASSASTRSGTSSMPRTSARERWPSTGPRPSSSTSRLRSSVPRRIPARPSRRCRPPGSRRRTTPRGTRTSARWLSQAEKLDLMRQRDLKLTSNAGETRA